MSRRNREPWDINKRNCECGKRIEPGNLTDSCQACLDERAVKNVERMQRESELAGALRTMLNDAKEFGHDYAAQKAAEAIIELFEPKRE